MANTRTAFLAVATLFLGTSEGTNQLRGTDTQGISVKIDDNGTRLFARYSDSQGRRLVQKCAKAIVNDDDDTDFTIFQADSECLDVLKASSIILSVEEDHPVHAFGDVALGPYRRLNEQVPWGIAAIQADQLDVGEHDVTVCIVDSGIAIGHPDFVADRVTGKDRTDKDWQWDKDRAGHGKLSPIDDSLDLVIQCSTRFKLTVLLLIVTCQALMSRERLPPPQEIATASAGLECLTWSSFGL